MNLKEKNSDNNYRDNISAHDLGVFLLPTGQMHLNIVLNTNCISHSVIVIIFHILVLYEQIN